MSNPTTIPGYCFGAVAPSPVTPEQFAFMQTSVLFGDEDIQYLLMSHDAPQAQDEATLAVWYGFVGATPYLL